MRFAFEKLIFEIFLDSILGCKLLTVYSEKNKIH